MKTGDEIRLKINRLGINAEGIGYFKKVIVFVEGALVGEEVIAVVTQVSDRMGFARTKKILKRSSDRINPECPHYASCGGCSLLHSKYPATLDFKLDLVKQSLNKFKVNLDARKFKPTIGMDDRFNYRNKAQYQLGFRDEKVIAGLYALNSHNLIDLHDCPIQTPLINSIIEYTTEIMTELNLRIYDERTHSGTFRSLVVRSSHTTNETQVIFVTANKDFPSRDILIEKLKNKFPEIKSIAQNINNQRTSLVLGAETKILYGDGYITEHLNDMEFKLSPRAFFQLNTKMAEHTYNLAINALKLSPDMTFLDAYSGIGTLGLLVAKKVKKVFGVEIIPEAVQDAKLNAKINHITNANYMAAAAEDLIAKFPSFDAGIVDPARVGLDKKFISAIINNRIKNLVYISCNPATLARDLKLLENAYEVESMQVVDMFPNTARVEVITKLRSK